MSDLDAIMLLEGGDATEEETIAAWQALLDSGIVWKLQGFYGRGATRLIAAGLIAEKGEPKPRKHQHTFGMV